MSRENKDLSEEIVEAVNDVEEKERKTEDILTLSSGVKLKLKAVNKFFLFQVADRFKPPKVPIVKMKGREEENPNDPRYVQELERHLADVGQVMNNTVLLRGVEVLEMPKDMITSDSEEWKEEMEILGLSTENKRARFLAWLKAIAVPNDEEMNLVLENVGRLTGVAEIDAAEAVERFRGSQGRGEDRQGSDLD